MFDTLVASGPEPVRGLPRLALSAGLHLAIIAAAVVLTGRPAPVIRARPPQPVMLFPEARRTGPPPVLERPLAPRPALSEVPAIPAVDALDLRPSIAPPALPTVGDIVARGTPPSAGEPLLRALGVGDAESGSEEPRTAATVDDPVEILSQPAPRYPDALAAMGRAGRVEVTYIVDTSGHAEPGSVRTSGSGHPAFEAAARASVLASRFRPARVAGRAVRQLVRQVFTFRVGERR